MYMAELFIQLISWCKKKTILIKNKILILSMVFFNGNLRRLDLVQRHKDFSLEFSSK